MSCKYFRVGQKTVVPETERVFPLTYESGICQAGVDTLAGGAVNWEKCKQALPNDRCHMLSTEDWKQLKRTSNLS